MNPSVFSEQFDLGDLHCTRLSQTPHDVQPTHVSNRITLPEGLGVARMEAYRRGHSVFVRLYHVQSGDFAWYSATRTPEKAQLENSNAELCRGGKPS